MILNLTDWSQCIWAVWLIFCSNLFSLGLKCDFYGVSESLKWSLRKWKVAMSANFNQIFWKESYSVLKFNTYLVWFECSSRNNFDEKIIIRISILMIGSQTKMSLYWNVDAGWILNKLFSFLQIFGCQKTVKIL